MSLLVPSCLMLVILTCSVCALVQIAARPLRLSVVMTDTTWIHTFPYSRLLDPHDFVYLQRSGFSPARVRGLRAERRRIAQQWLHSLAADFNRIDHLMRLLLLASAVDRPDLASALARQRAILCWHFHLVALRLTLDRFGTPSGGTLTSMQSLEALCAGMRTLSRLAQISAVAGS